jgi:hypothetical protein
VFLKKATIKKIMDQLFWDLSCFFDTETTFQMFGNSIGGAHQQTSQRAAPPVSVEEKGKATGDKRKMLLFLLMSIQY